VSFIVKRKDGIKIVIRPEDLIYTPRDKVFLRLASNKEMEFGTAQYYAKKNTKGIAEGNHGPSLLNMLDPAKPEYVNLVPPVITGSDLYRRAFRSMTNIEGHLFALNTWDHAYMSIGPIQKTLGVGAAKGELQAAYKKIELNGDAATVKMCLNNYGVTFLASATDETGSIVYRGKVAESGEEKQQYKDFAWAYRFLSVLCDFETDKYKENCVKAFLQASLDRIEIVAKVSAKLKVKITKDVPKPDGTMEKKTEDKDVTTTAGDVFKTDLGLAVLLQHHIKAPAHVKSGAIWVTPLKEVLEAKNSDSVSGLTEKEEWNIIGKAITKSIAHIDDARSRISALLAFADQAALKELAKELGHKDGADGSLTKFFAAYGMTHKYIQDVLTLKR
jgi:hypothetical protein